jgi:hypothetical protein
MNATIARVINAFLHEGEELIEVERLQTRTSVATRALTLGYSNLANQYHFIGLTNSRVIIVPLNRITGKPNKDEVFSRDFDEIEINKDRLCITPPGKDTPKKYFFMSGIGGLTGLNKDEFLYLLEKKKSI